MMSENKYGASLTQQKRYIKPMLFKRWATVKDAGPTLKHHWFNVSCLLATLDGFKQVLDQEKYHTIP